MSALAAFKATVKHDTIRPFALSSEAPWIAIKYRYDSAEPWLNALETSFHVLPSDREDVRKDVVHDFQIVVDLAAVEADGIDPRDVELLVLTRDNFAKKIVHLLRAPLRHDSYTLTIPRVELDRTSLASRIDFEIMLVAVREIALPHRRIRHAGRLASHTVTVSTERKGHTFNFTRATADQFAQRGLPRSTTFFVDVPSPHGLLEACDDISAALTVLVHEDAWSTLQEIRTGDRIGEAIGNFFLANVIVSILAVARQGASAPASVIEEGSIAMRLLSRIADKAGISVARLEELLKDPDGLMTLQAVVHAALRLTNSLNRATLGESGQP